MFNEKMKQTIFYDFCLVIRECCLKEEINQQEIQICGELADYLHNIACEDFNSEIGQLELREYVNFIENHLNNKSFENPSIFYRLIDQLSTLVH